MPPLEAADVVRLLAEMGERSALVEDTPYRSRAYLRAARNLAGLTVPLHEVIAAGRLKQIPGVGDAIARVIAALQRTGNHPALEALRAEAPYSLVELVSVPGLGSGLIMKLYREFGIASLDDLEKALRERKIKGVKGFGPAAQKKVLEGIAIRRHAQGAVLLDEAEELLEIAADGLTAHPIGRISFAGEFRRGCETVADLGLAAERTAPAKGTQIQKTVNGCAIYLSGPQSFGSALLFATGSKAHLQELVTIAAKKQMELKPDGLYRTGKALPSSTEEEIYNALGLPFIPPELREGADENKLGRRGRIPDLVCEADIKGILHAHTDASDGVASLEEMARAVQEGGYAYFGVTDHSQSAHYAGGLKVDEIAAQHAAIDALNGSAGAGFRIFKGIEADILPDGSLDYPDDILSRFDFVIASVHSRFQLDRKSQTERMLKAVANPYTTILGHMTGRQLLRRQGYDIDIERVLQACASHGVAVEINGNPIRLDLDWRWHRRAMEFGCLFSINPDAHSIAEIGLVRWGVKVARKGAVPAERVLNALSLREFGNYLDRRRRSFR